MTQSLLEELDSTLDENYCVSDEAEREEFRSMLVAIKEQARLDAIEQCISRYIEAEIDFTTPGEQGIGRMSLSPPRLGGYLRKHFARFSAQELQELRKLMRSLIFRGYVAYILNAKTFVPTTGQATADQMFEPWICRIYVMKIQKEVDEMIRGVIWTPFTALKQFLASKKAVGGGMFSADKTETILFWYPFAGFSLRHTEVGGRLI